MDSSRDPSPGSGAPPFERAANTERLQLAVDQLVGHGRWIRRSGLGTFPIRFPNLPEPDDTGWHCDGSFGESPYRLNLRSRGRALLMLFLFSDVGEDDAPTRIRVGSHLDVPPSSQQVERKVCHSLTWPNNWEVPPHARSSRQRGQRETSTSVTLPRARRSGASRQSAPVHCPTPVRARRRA